MKIKPNIEAREVEGPAAWDDVWGICLPLDHIICYEMDGTPHTVGEFLWPWGAYTADRSHLSLHFYYWKISGKNLEVEEIEISLERVARVRELQFLMTRQIYYGEENAPMTLYRKLNILLLLARFAEAKKCTIRAVLEQTKMLDDFGASIPDFCVSIWMAWIRFLFGLDSKTELGITLATSINWRNLERRAKAYSDQVRQCAPIPSRIYGILINNISSEIDDIVANRDKLLNALRYALVEYRTQKNGKSVVRGVGRSLIKKFELSQYLKHRGICNSRIRGLGAAISNIYMVCKLQIHFFSGMREKEVNRLPYHCMLSENGEHGKSHCLIVGNTTKFNKGRRLRTKWVTTDSEGFRAIRLVQEFASIIYNDLGIQPQRADRHKDKYPLFVSSDYLPWMQLHCSSLENIAAFAFDLVPTQRALLSRICPIITEEDIAELEAIDPYRSWREEPKYAVGQRWPLTTHQSRRSLVIYANASGLVRTSSLRRQLQHVTREMTFYYGRGSPFCKNFIADDFSGYKKHVAVDWQNGEEEAEMLAFIRDVLNCKEPMFGGAGTFYTRRRELGAVMSREEVAQQMKAGLLSYRESPLGGCTRPTACEARKGLKLIDTVCVTEGCKYLIGKHSKIAQTIRLKRAALSHVTPGSLTAQMEEEELVALEKVEKVWRPD